MTTESILTVLIADIDDKIKAHEERYQRYQNKRLPSMAASEHGAAIALIHVKAKLENKLIVIEQIKQSKRDM
ncbi:hypothetical protein [Bacillus manliponensis]|uniref:hypothetical protein n=1 Tax=Bacillus manliponensis TaxID=574376 RepID=UPI003516AB76